MHTTPKLDFLPPEYYGAGVRVDVVDLLREGRQLSPFKASRIVVAPGEWSPLDEHEVKECWFIASGRGKLIYAESIEEQVGPGDFLFYDPFKSHRILNEGTEELVIFSLWW